MKAFITLLIKQIRYFLDQMRQKRELYHKEIRRKALNTFFQKNRFKHFNYNIQTPAYKTTQLDLAQQVKTQIDSEFQRYSQEIYDSLAQQNILNLLSSVKDFFYLLKKLLLKYNQNPEGIAFIVENWFKYRMDQLIIDSAKFFENSSPKSFSGVRKQVFKYAISHYHLIFQYYSIIKAPIDRKRICNLVFLSLNELSNLPKSIKKILLLIDSLINFSKETRHEFFFQNSKQANESMVSFEKICSIIAQNKEKFKTTNDSLQLSTYIQIKMLFLDFFVLYGYELQYMQKYIQVCKNKGQTKNKDNLSLFDCIYEKTLQLYEYPSKLGLNTFLSNQVLRVILQTIDDMRKYHLDHWVEKAQNQQNLADSLHAFKMMIDYYPKEKFLRTYLEEFQTLLGLVIVSKINIEVKNQVLYLIDSVIFWDQNNEITDQLIRNNDLFQIIWSYQEPLGVNVKFNIINNILLCTSGFHAVNRHLSEIVIMLHSEPRFVCLALTFILNYFTFTKFDLQPKSRVSLVIQLLYSLPGQSFGREQVQKDAYIFSHLYDNGFSRKLPERYEIWRREIEKISFTNDQSDECDSEKYEIVMKTIEIFEQYLGQQHIMDGCMEQE